MINDLPPRMLWNGEPVTVKRLHTKPKKSTCIDLIIEELNNLLKLQNNSIVTLIGASRDYFAANQVLVFERIAFGSLFDYLHVQKNVLSYDQSAIVMRQISCALNYLHRNRFVHCSITSHAVFLTDNYHAKLGNFEYLTSFESQQPCLVISNRYLNSTYNWMAPEVMEGLKPSPVSDVYSFTSVFWEATQGCIPWVNAPFNLIYDKVVNGKWSCLAFEAVNSQKTVTVPDKFLDIISSGMQHNPLNRMSMTKIERILSKYVEDNSCCPPTFEKPSSELNTLNSSPWNNMEEIPSDSLNLPLFPEPSFAHGSSLRYFTRSPNGKGEKPDNQGHEKSKSLTKTLCFASESKRNSAEISKRDYKLASHSHSEARIDKTFLVGEKSRSLGDVKTCQERFGTKLALIQKEINKPNPFRDSECKSVEEAIVNPSPKFEHDNKIEKIPSKDGQNVQCSNFPKESDVTCGGGPYAPGVVEVDLSNKVHRQLLEEDGFEGLKNDSVDLMAGAPCMALLKMEAKRKELENSLCQDPKKSPGSRFEENVYCEKTQSSAVDALRVGVKSDTNRKCLNHSYKIDFLKIEGVSAYEEISNRFKNLSGNKVDRYRENEQSTYYQKEVPSVSESVFHHSSYISRETFFESNLLTPTFSEKNLSFIDKATLMKSSSQLKVDLSYVGLPQPFKKKGVPELERNLKEETENYLGSCTASEKAGLCGSQFYRNEHLFTSKNVEMNFCTNSPASNVGKISDTERVECEGDYKNSTGFEEAIQLNISSGELSKIGDNFCVRESTAQDQISLGCQHRGFLDYMKEAEQSYSIKYETDLRIGCAEGTVSTLMDSNIKKQRFKRFSYDLQHDGLDDGKSNGTLSLSGSIQQFSFNGRKLVQNRSLSRQCQLPAVGVKPASHLINAKVLKPLDPLLNSVERHTCQEANLFLNTSIRDIIKSYEDKISKGFNQLGICKRIFPECTKGSPYIRLAESSLLGTEINKDSFSLSTPQPEKHGDCLGDDNGSLMSDVVHISGLKIYVGGGDGTKTTSYENELFGPGNLGTSWYDEEARKLM